MIRFSIRHPVTISMVTLAVALFGVLAALRLPVDLLPRITYPTLTIRSELIGAAPAEIEELLARPLEEAVGVIGGVQRIVSRSLPGLVEIQLEFGWGRDMDFAALDVREQLDRVRLPEGSSRPLVLRYDPNLDPILRLGLQGEAGLSELRELAERLVERNLETVEGVAAVKTLGGIKEEVVVALDQERLFRAGLSPEMVRQRLAGENLNRAGGSLLVGDTRYLVRVLNEFRSAEELAEMVLLTAGTRQVRLGDVAEVERRAREREVLTRIDGKEAVELAIYREGDANTVAVARRVDKRLEQVRERLPAGTTLIAVSDQSAFITASAREVVLTALYGGILAVLVLFLFLRDLRSTAVVAVSIPISVLFALLLMLRTGVSINIMSLGGLALGVGMVVDSSIVVLEAIARRREGGEAKAEASERGAGEVAAAVIASTLTTCAVFFPIVFVEGLAGSLFKDLSLTVGAALAGSLLVSLTLIPMLLARGGERQRSGVGWQDPEPLRPVHQGRVARWMEWLVVGGLAWLTRRMGWILGGIRRVLSWLWAPLLNGFDRLFARCEFFYPRLVRASLRQRAAVLVGSVLLFVAALWGGGLLGSELIPELAQGTFDLEIRLPDGTPLETTERVAAGIERQIIELDGVARVAAVVGGGAADALDQNVRGANDARIGVRVDRPGDRAREAAVAAAVRRIAADVPDLSYQITQPTLFSFEAPLEVEVYGRNLPDLLQVAEAIRGRLGGLPELRDVALSTRPGSPELIVRFDPLALARTGLDQSRAAGIVRDRLEGVIATRLRRGEEVIDVRVRGVDEDRRRVAALGDMILNPGEAVPVRLRAVAEIIHETGPTEIRRIAQERAVVVSASLTEASDLGAALVAVEGALADLPRPAGIRVDIAGQTRAMGASFDSLRFAMFLALFLVYLVMASQFESLVHPLVILLTVPLGLTGVVAALALTGSPINVVVLIGAVMLAGIMVNNSIVLVDAVNRRRARGLEVRDALVEAAAVRLRPILMTTVTTVLGLLPMSLGWGEGGELRAPLAVTVIGGLIVSTLVSLVVVPVLYDSLEALTRFGRAGGPEPLPKSIAPGRLI